LALKFESPLLSLSLSLSLALFTKKGKTDADDHEIDGDDGYKRFILGDWGMGNHKRTMRDYFRMKTRRDTKQSPESTGINSELSAGFVATSFFKRSPSSVSDTLAHRVSTLIELAVV
jgi:hypothetical protein